MSRSDASSKPILQPFDRVAIGLMLILSLLIALLLLQGDRTLPRIRDFSWHNKQIGTEDRAFILTFSRPMDRDSVEKNLQIDPNLPGKISWAGRRMAYTLNKPAPYGINYQLKVQAARERYSLNQSQGTPMEPFTGSFSTRDRAFAYIGIEGIEAGRLMLVNLTQQQEPIAITPPDLVVMDFKPYPQSNKILFSAQDIKNAKSGSFDTSLYTVTTGINPLIPGESNNANKPAGQLEKLLDSKEYQNLKFDLSPDGKTIVVQRVSQTNPGSDFGLWVIQPPEAPKRLETQPGGEFLIHPDGNSLAIAQGEGVAILPIKPAAESEIKPLDFLPKFGRLLNFSQDGAAAAMVQFNKDYTRSLFLVTNQGDQTELLRTTGSILSAQFDPLKQYLYCLLTQLNTENDEYREEPYIAQINLTTKKQTPLVVLPKQRDVDISIAPDGLALLFDQAVSTPANQTGAGLRNNAGESITNSLLWILPLVSDEPQSTAALEPEQLPFNGLRPRWLP